MKEAPSPHPHPDQSASLPATIRDSCGLRVHLSLSCSLSLSFSLLQDVPPACVAQMGLRSFCSSPHERERPRWARHTSPHVCPAGASSVSSLQKTQVEDRAIAKGQVQVRLRSGATDQGLSILRRPARPQRPRGNTALPEWPAASLAREGWCPKPGNRAREAWEGT